MSVILLCCQISLRRLRMCVCMYTGAFCVYDMYVCDAERLIWCSQIVWCHVVCEAVFYVVLVVVRCV